MDNHSHQHGHMGGSNSPGDSAANSDGSSPGSPDANAAAAEVLSELEANLAKLEVILGQSSPETKAIVERLLTLRGQSQSGNAVTLLQPSANAGRVSGVVTPDPTVTEVETTDSAPEEATNPASESDAASRANTFKALLIPGLLLAALIGTLIAFASSKGWLPSSSVFRLGNAVVDTTKTQQLMQQGASQLQQGKYQEAIASYNQVIEQDSAAYDAYLGRGLAFHRSGNTDAALKDYTQAITLLEQLQQQDVTSQPPDLRLKLAQAYNNRSHVYYDIENYPASKEDANKAIAFNQNLAIAHINLGNAHHKIENPSGALQEYTLALQLKPNPVEMAGAYTNRGNVYALTDQYPNALKDYEQAIRTQADYANAYYNLGLAHANLSQQQDFQTNVEKAIANLQKASTLFKQQNQPQLSQQAANVAQQLQRRTPQPPSASPRSVSMAEF